MKAEAMACVEQCASDVVLTPELHAIVSTDVAAGETLKIEAAAGSGKSTALRLFAEHRRDRHILYLTFTKAEAKAKQADYARRGLDHVVVSTLHARAFAATEDLHGGHVVESSRFQAADAARLTSTSAVEWTAARRDALGCAFAAFLASDVDEPCAVHVECGVPDRVELLDAARAIWRAVCEGTAGLPLTHDMYLKLCAVHADRRERMFGNAELVLLDEAHDCTEAQIALATAPGRSWGTVVVYDFHQRIYGWRRAAKAAYIHALPAIAIRALTCSWRFGGALASLAARLLTGHTGQRVSIESSAEHETRIVEVAAAPFVRVCGVGRELTVVARTRRSLFNAAMAGLATEAVERVVFGDSADGAYSMFGGRDQLLDTFALYMGRARHDMADPEGRMAQFAEVGYAQFRQAAFNSGWQEAVEACTAVETFNRALPGLVRKLDAAMRSSSSQVLVLATVHEAKGREWPHVYADPDLRRITFTGENADEVLYRLNLMYVAMTRARTVLYLPTPVVGSWLRMLGIDSV